MPVPTRRSVWLYGALGCGVGAVGVLEEDEPPPHADAASVARMRTVKARAMIRIMDRARGMAASLRSAGTVPTSEASRKRAGRSRMSEANAAIPDERSESASR